MIATRGRRVRAVMLTTLLATALIGCDGAASARPTDPREILANAIRTTAGLPTLRLHLEVGTDMGQGGAGVVNGKMTMAFDADVDLAGRQLAGRTTMQFPVGL